MGGDLQGMQEGQAQGRSPQAEVPLPTFVFPKPVEWLLLPSIQQREMKAVEVFHTVYREH